MQNLENCRNFKEYVDRLITLKGMASIILMNGVRLRGKITGYSDGVCLFIGSNSENFGRQAVLLNAVSTIFVEESDSKNDGVSPHAEKCENLSTFLEEMINHEKLVSIFILNGIRMSVTVKMYDVVTQSILVSDNRNSQKFVFLKAISTISECL